MKVLQVRLTDEEHARLKSTAYVAGMTITDFIKALLPAEPATPSGPSLKTPESHTEVVPSIPEEFKTARQQASEAMFGEKLGDE